MWCQFRSHILGWFWTLVLRFLAGSWRKEFIQLQTLDDLLAERRPGVIAFWHGKYVPLFVLLRNRNVRVFTTASKRGEVIAVVSRRFGFAVTQLPDNAPAHSLRVLREALCVAPTGAIAVDGPLGPYHLVKHGTIEVASELGCTILPISVAAHRSWLMADRWDRMEIPLPFTRVCVAIGNRMSIPADLSAEELPHWAERLAADIDAATRLAEQRVSNNFHTRLEEPEPAVNPQPSQPQEVRSLSSGVISRRSPSAIRFSQIARTAHPSALR
jgi:lysophospholipid acyltransferase (LPLAT)-like uncharacterized protein